MIMERYKPSGAALDTKGHTWLTICLLISAFAYIPFISTGANAVSIKAYCNGQEATVTGISFMVGEPFTVEVNVTPEENAGIYIMLYEPGYKQAYDRISGETKGAVIQRRCDCNMTEHFKWVLAANGNWSNGTAPVNVYYQIEPEDGGERIRGGFTVVNPYLKSERYTNCDEGQGTSGSILVTKVYYEGMELDAREVAIDSGKPFTVDARITPAGNTTVIVTLYGPGQAYQRVKGDDMGVPIRVDCTGGETSHFRWMLVADDGAIGTVMPLNITYKVVEEDGPGKKLIFGDDLILNAYISDGTDERRETAIGLIAIVISLLVICCVFTVKYGRL